MKQETTSRKRTNDSTSEPSSKRTKSVHILTDDEAEAETCVPLVRKRPASSSKSQAVPEAPQAAVDPLPSEQSQKKKKKKDKSTSHGGDSKSKKEKKHKKNTQNQSNWACQFVYAGFS
ncbi:uncharacterized protein LOC123893282 [Trifolium pratense]|uniref:uncharacterized protein LOC123893282 n=1 Tax=Trifolium pratense TaxID=57577 RepID=UPI001E692BB8|nr:uncharacterized protein LOC123893282 [Trifolium pratense]XP_045799172.1 uncharacterized protein LOC123893282 [Trifolium pratense]